MNVETPLGAFPPDIADAVLAFIDAAREVWRRVVEVLEQVGAWLADACAAIARDLDTVAPRARTTAPRCGPPPPPLDPRRRRRR